MFILFPVSGETHLSRNLLQWFSIVTFIGVEIGVNITGQTPSKHPSRLTNDNQKRASVKLLTLPKPFSSDDSSPIGMIGFEPTTPASRKQCATKLRYIPPKFQYTTKKGG
jgi:hypothetical protein